MRSPLLALCLVAAALLPSLAQAQGEEPAPPDWLDAQVTVRFASLTEATVEGVVDVHKVALAGSPRTAQQVRDTYAGLERFGQGETFLMGLEAALQGRLASSLGGVFPGSQVEVHRAQVDRLSLVGQGPDPFHPPVRAAFNATVRISLASLGLAGGSVDLDEDTVRAAFELGASASVPANLTAQPGWNVTFTFVLPAWVKLGAADQATLSPDGSTATWEVRNWHGLAAMRLPARVTLQARDAPPPMDTDAHVTLDVDMRDVVGLSLPGLASGDLGALDVTFTARVIARSLRIGDFPVLQAQLDERLPASLEVPGLNADALRLAVEQGLLPEDMLDRIEAYFEAIAVQRMSGFGPDNVTLVGGFEDGSLDARHVSRPLDGDPPLAYTVTAAFRIPLSHREAARLGAATTGPALLQRELTFDLPRVRGLDTSYRIALPEGIALADVQVEGGRVERGEEGGRDVVVVTPEDENARATFTVAVTTGFVLSKFWYLGLGLVLSLALSISFLLLRRMRRRGKAQKDLPPEGAPAAAEEPAPPAPEPMPAPPPPSAGPQPR